MVHLDFIASVFCPSCGHENRVRSTQTPEGTFLRCEECGRSLGLWEMENLKPRVELRGDV